MKLLNIDWWQFFKSLEMYRELPLVARRGFIDQVKPSAAVSRNQLPFWPELMDSGLMAANAAGVNANVKVEHREFSRAIRAMSRARVLDTPSRDTLHHYLNDNLTNSETAALGGSYLYGRTGFEGLQRLFANISSAGWAKKFLTAKTDWERDFADPAQPRYFSVPAVLKAAQTMVRAVADQEQPVLLQQLPQLCQGIPPDVFSAAMRGVMRYLLLFPALRSSDLEPIIGLWPGVAEKLANKPVSPPVPVEVSQTFHATFAMDDMVAVLSACAADPIRLRSSDAQIFEADRKSLAEGLASLPEWVAQSFRLDPYVRISRAVDLLYDLDFTDRTSTGDFRLVATPEGTDWLALPAKERMRFILDLLRQSVKEHGKGNFVSELPPLLPGISWMGSRPGGENLIEVVMQAYAEIPPGVYYRFGDFLEYESRTRNALAETVNKNRNFTLHVGGMYLSSPSEEEIDAAWQGFLSGMLSLRLVPLGGAMVGVDTEKQQISISITDIGRYLLGAAKDFEIPPDPEAQILIQPNFEVVFLGASARMEAEFARFAERKGRHVGTLFRITKQSIQAAAAAGMSAEGILAVLRETCPAGVPSNVSSEIGAWFRRFRQVEVRPAVIVKCPDDETAGAVLALLGKKASRLSPTVLELADKKIPPAVAKKLRDAGIFVRSVTGVPV